MKKIFTLILSLALMQAFGQTAVLQVVSSAGANYSTTNMSISWTIGEPVISTLTSANLILTQGFHQGHLIDDEVTSHELSSLSLKMFPNPATNKVWFEVNNQQLKGSFIVEVYDITGRKIINEDLGEFVSNELKELSIASLHSGIYLVKVKIGGFNSNVIKLIKE